MKKTIFCCIVFYFVVCLSLSVNGVELTRDEFKIYGTVESLHADGIVSVLFSHRPDRENFGIIEDKRVIGRVDLISPPIFINEKYRIFRYMAYYSIHNPKDAIRLKAGSLVGILLPHEKGKRDFSDKPFPQPRRFKAFIVGKKDGREMVFVPGGKFVMGSNARGKDEYPEHISETQDFYIDKYEVSNRDYLRYIKEMNAPLPLSWNGIERDDDFPVLVNYFEAESYARWAGKRLPTEKEWEKAARGTGLVYIRKADESFEMIRQPREYPWGLFDSSKANVAEFWVNPGVRKEYTEKFPKGLLPINFFEGAGESEYGALNMCGNAPEWTSSDYRAYPGNPYPNSKFGTMYKTIRGGAWYS
ncbi:MAG: formylglycine-generating enzyme family protein, partial [Spirochaetes bacterium]|nr:formylglycine-generating enzyme family protein [Spirochaetota bacterium]